MASSKPRGKIMAGACGLLVAVLWASAFPAIRVAAPELGVIGLSLGRLWVAALALLAIGAFMGVRIPRRDDLLLIIGCGVIGMAAYQVLLGWGELYVPAGTTSMIVSASPIVSVLIAAWLLRERLSAITIVGSLVAVSGVALVCLARAGVALSPAVWIIVAAGLLLGIYNPLTRPLLRKYSGLEVATYATVAGAVITTLMTPWAWADMVSASGSAWLSTVYLGLFPSALGYALWGHALSYLTVSATTSFLYLVPPIAVTIAYFWLGEIPNVVEGVGGAVVLLGVLLINSGGLTRWRMRKIEPSTDRIEGANQIASD